MPLHIPAEWRFSYTGPELSEEINTEFIALVRKIAAGTELEWRVVSIFNAAFGQDVPSDNTASGYGVLKEVFRRELPNPPQYLKRFWSAIEQLGELGIPVPTVREINLMLDRHEVSIRIDDKTMMLGESSEFVLDSHTEVDSSVSFGNSLTRDQQIGQGGFSVVYRVTKRTTFGEYEFALKTLNAIVDEAGLERAKQRFIQEGRALTTLQHRAIVTQIEAGVSRDGIPYILMPLINGKGLRDSGLQGDAIRTTTVFIEIARGLQHAHERGILHRDLKPSNVLVRASDGQPQILDFGCVYFLDTPSNDLLTTREAPGTKPYIPREVQEDPGIKDPRQDIYACGKMLYEVLVGHLPQPTYKPLATLDASWAPLDRIVQACICDLENIIASASVLVDLLIKSLADLESNAVRSGLVIETSPSLGAIHVAEDFNIVTKKELMPELNEVDMTLFRAAFEYSLHSNSANISVSSALTTEELQAIGAQERDDFFEIAEKAGYIATHRTFGGVNSFVILPNGFRAYASIALKNIADIESSIREAIVYDGLRDDNAISTAVKQPRQLVLYILNLFEERGEIQLSKMTGKVKRIDRVSASISRKLPKISGVDAAVRRGRVVFHEVRFQHYLDAMTTIHGGAEFDLTEIVNCATFDEVVVQLTNAPPVLSEFGDSLGEGPDSTHDFIERIPGTMDNSERACEFDFQKGRLMLNTNALLYFRGLHRMLLSEAWQKRD